MRLSANITLQHKLFRWSSGMVAGICVIASLVLVGWITNVPLLKTIGVSFGAMTPVTAFCFLLISVAFYLLASSKRNYAVLGYIFTCIVFFITVVKFGVSVFNWRDVVNILLQGHESDQELIRLTRISPSVSLGFMIASIGLVFTYLLPRQSLLLVQSIAVMLFTLGLLAILGYLYKAEKLYGIILSMPMSFFTGLCFILISLSILFLKPDAGLMALFTSSRIGGVLTRVFVPAAIIIPSVFGIVVLSGYNKGQYNVEHGFLYYVLSIVVILVAFVSYYAFLLNKRDRMKLEAEQALEGSEEQLRTIFDGAPEGIIMLDTAGRVRRWNPEANKLLGWNKEEVMGRVLSDLIIPAAFKDTHSVTSKPFSFISKSTIIGETHDLPVQTKGGQILNVSIRISSLVINDEQFFVGFVRDITERKKMELQLRRFNESLEHEVKEKTKELVDMFERVTDGFIALDKNYCYTYVNKKAGEMIRRNPEDLMGKCIWDVFPDVVGSPTYLAFQTAMNTQNHVQNVDYYQPFDLWQENTVYPSNNGLSIFIRDISQQKMREREITEAKVLADRLIDSLPGVFYFYDVNGRFIKWNKKLEEATGYSGDEIAEMHPVQLFPHEEKAYISNRIATVFEQGFNDAEAHFISKTGERTAYYFKAVMLEYNGAACLLGTGIDITERKKAEESLKRSELKYKLLFEQNPVPMWILSLPGYKVIDVNGACLQQYGYERREFMDLDMRDLLFPEEVPKMLAQLNTNFRGLHKAGMWRHQNKSGSIIYADIMTHDIYYQDLPARLVSAKDISEQYLAEEKLKHSYDEIKELTEYLQKVREDERMRMSHEIHDELGQLLTVLKMDISWINKRVPETNIQVKKKIAETINMVDHTIKTVRRIASELRPALLDDLGLQAAMMWHIREFENRSGIQADADLMEGNFQLSDDQKTGFYRILQESLTNVARHSHADRVIVLMDLINEKLILTISDNGRGFDAGKSTLKTLGLLGMKERAQGMGGEYSIQSTPGKGTLVTVVLPLENEAVTVR